MSDTFRSGEHYVICDICGFKMFASETRKRWDGMRTCKKDWEQRHPQDFVKGRRDRQVVANGKPEAPDTFIDPGDVTEGDL